MASCHDISARSENTRTVFSFTHTYLPAWNCVFFSYKANGAIHSLDHLGHTHALHAIMDWDIAHKSSHNDFFLDAFED